MPSYTYQTLSGAQSDLASRLYQQSADPTQQFWTPAELTMYITEALRAWNAFTSFFRAEFVFPTVANQFWYDITTQAGSLRPMTVTDNSLLQIIEAHLLEPVNGGYPLSWAGSSQYSVADILDAIQTKRDETLSRTSCTMTQGDVASVPGRTVLSDFVLNIRRVAWLPASGFGFSAIPLRQSDTWAKRAFDNLWTTVAQSPPQVWMESSEPPVSFDVDRVQPCPAQFDVLTVNAGAELSTTAATVLGVPDDWSWVIKYGALADLFSREGTSKDALRQQYCERRYQEGLALMGQASAILELRLNGLPMTVDAVTNGDTFNPGWQGAVAGPPTSCYTTGLNLIAFGPQPDAGPYSVVTSVIQNATVPVNAGDFIQISRADYDAMLDEAQHIAMLKSGGAEFAATVTLHQNFLERASLYNRSLSVTGQFWDSMQDISKTDMERNPVYAPARRR